MIFLKEGINMRFHILFSKEDLKKSTFGDHINDLKRQSLKKRQ